MHAWVAIKEASLAHFPTTDSPRAAQCVTVTLINPCNICTRKSKPIDYGRWPLRVPWMALPLPAGAERGHSQQGPQFYLAQNLGLCKAMQISLHQGDAPTYKYTQGSVNEDMRTWGLLALQRLQNVTGRGWGDSSSLKRLLYDHEALSSVPAPTTKVRHSCIISQLQAAVKCPDSKKPSELGRTQLDTQAW